MARTHGYRARLAALLAAFALLGAMGMTSRVSAQELDDFDDVTVSGTSVPTLNVDFGDLSAAFGTNLTPDGAVSNSGDTVSFQLSPATPSVGACYVWNSAINVESNLDYDISVGATSLDSDLSFVTGAITDYAVCIGGQTLPVPAPDPFAWLEDQLKGPATDHDYALTTDVRWNEAPGSTSNTLTFTVQQLAEV